MKAKMYITNDAELQMLLTAVDYYMKCIDGEKELMYYHQLRESIRTCYYEE